MLTESPEAPPQPSSPPRRRKIVLRVAVALLALLVLGVALAIGFVFWTDSKIERLPEEELPSLTPVAEAGPRTFLVVGTDDRSDLPDEFDDVFGNFPGSRTDTIILVNFSPGEGAQLLSLPRDLKVEIPGVDSDGIPYGTNRINAAFVFGGPELLIATIQANLGIEVNHYMEIDLAGFAELVDAIGGVKMVFNHDARDEKSGLDVEAGIRELNGEQALAYVRSRKYQEFRKGEWKTVGGNDIGRTKRQQQLLLNLFDQVASRKNVFNLPTFASTFAEEVTVDSGLTLGVIVDLRRSALDLSLGDIDAATLPVIDNKGEDGRAYVVPGPGAEPYLEAFRDRLPLP